MAGPMFSAAPLEDACRVQIFYDADTAVFRGIVIEYRNGGQRRGAMQAWGRSEPRLYYADTCVFYWGPNRVEGQCGEHRGRSGSPLWKTVLDLLRDESSFGL